MLDRCLPGHTRTEKKHHIWVTYQGKVFQGLQLGDRSKGDPPIGTGHVRRMIRVLEVEDPNGCCASFFPWLANCVVAPKPNQ